MDVAISILHNGRRHHHSLDAVAGVAEIKDGMDLIKISERVWAKHILKQEGYTFKEDDVEDKLTESEMKPDSFVKYQFVTTTKRFTCNCCKVKRKKGTIALQYNKDTYICLTCCDLYENDGSLTVTDK